MIDYLFLLASGAFGWGLSLATYRFFARRYDWPMGAVHVDLPAVPMVIGVLALGSGLIFAAARGMDAGGWAIIVFGLLLALFWTGFLRVGSQASLILAPIAAVWLLIGWAGQPIESNNTTALSDGSRKTTTTGINAGVGERSAAKPNDGTPSE